MNEDDPMDSADEDVRADYIEGVMEKVQQEIESDQAEKLKPAPDSPTITIGAVGSGMGGIASA